MKDLIRCRETVFERTYFYDRGIEALMMSTILDATKVKSKRILFVVLRNTKCMYAYSRNSYADRCEDWPVEMLRIIIS